MYPRVLLWREFRSYPRLQPKQRSAYHLRLIPIWGDRFISTNPTIVIEDSVPALPVAKINKSEEAISLDTTARILDQRRNID